MNFERVAKCIRSNNNFILKYCCQKTHQKLDIVIIVELRAAFAPTRKDYFEKKNVKSVKIALFFLFWPRKSW